jgi:hypothetical protein
MFISSDALSTTVTTTLTGLDGLSETAESRGEPGAEYQPEDRWTHNLQLEQHIPHCCERANVRKKLTMNLLMRV